MENLVKRCAGFEFEKTKDGAESTSESRESNSSGTLSGDSSAGGSSSPPLFGWPIRKASGRKVSADCVNGNAKKVKQLDDSKVKSTRTKISEAEMMKERFAKLLLGEDMSGSGKGACTALAISNAITNLCASIFGQLWSLEPLSSEKKTMWRREMEMLLCVSDHIVEMIPSMQSFPDGKKLEVMTCRPRSDLFANLPALRKLDNMLLEILESFKNTEFWYVDQGIVDSESDGSSSFRKTILRHEEKWWLPVPRLPPDGLSEKTKKQLNHTRECTTQILKAAMAINATSLAEMDVPESYLESLPKNGRSCLGDVIYRYITSDKFSADHLLDCLDLASEHLALEIANRVEASIYVWRRRAHSKPQVHNPSRSTTKTSWEIVKDLMVDGGDKRELLAERAESLLLCLKQRFPGLTQTTLDVCKIQCNKDVGKSILESYSRVLESLAYNIIARIDDLLYVDDLTKQSDTVNLIPAIPHHKKPPVRHNSSMPVSGTPFKPTLLTPSFSPRSVPLISPARGEKSPFPSSKNSGKINEKPPRRGGSGVRRALSNYLGVESKPRICGHHPADDDSCSVLNDRNPFSPIDSKSNIPRKSTGTSVTQISREDMTEGGSENRRDSSVGQKGINAHQSCPKYTVM